MTNSRLPGFKDLTVAQRRQKVIDAAGVESRLPDVLSLARGLSIEQADHMAENVIGVIAASNLARMTRDQCGVVASSTPPLMPAQVQVLDVIDPSAARLRLLAASDELVELANAQDPKLVAIGGGVRDVTVSPRPQLRPSHSGSRRSPAAERCCGS
jgi:hydroxymethylglutaryl-CoA reductase